MSDATTVAQHAQVAAKIDRQLDALRCSILERKKVSEIPGYLITPDESAELLQLQILSIERKTDATAEDQTALRKLKMNVLQLKKERAEGEISAWTPADEDELTNRTYRYVRFVTSAW